MAGLFVRKSIDINATPAEVWSALTNPAATKQWAGEFGMAGGIESTWQLGAPVIWKGEDSQTYVQGTVTALAAPKLLRFTVFDVRAERPKTGEEDGITFRLSETNGHTNLSVIQGDFGKVPNGQKYRDLTEPIWDQVLPIVKKLAEKVN